MAVETIRIKDKGFPGGLVINKVDFDEESMTAMKEKPIPEKPEEEEEEDGDSETAEDLAANNSRAELEQLAKDVGLDGNKYTNKPELAKAILAARSE